MSVQKANFYNIFLKLRVIVIFQLNNNNGIYDGMPTIMCLPAETADVT